MSETSTGFNNVLCLIGRKIFAQSVRKNIIQKYRDTGMSRKVHKTQCRLELLSRESKIALHWSGAQPGSADNFDNNKTIEQPLQELRR